MTRCVCPAVKNDMGGITVIQVQSSDVAPLTAQVLLTTSPSRPAMPPASSAPPASLDPQTSNKPRRTGSLALFFRKVSDGRQHRMAPEPKNASWVSLSLN